MASIKGAIATLGGFASSLTDFGIKVIVALVVVDILFPAISYTHLTLPTTPYV